MDDAQKRELALRKELNVPDDVGVEDVLKLILEAGWKPHPICEEHDGNQLYACPVSSGIFRTVQSDEHGRLGQESSPTPILAVLEGLRRARTWERE